jgi:hypothetical protein
MKIFPVFIELKKPSGGHPGHVIQGFYSLDGDTVILVDQFGDPMTDADGKSYRRKLAENQNPGTIAGTLLQNHWDARPNKSRNGFDRPIQYPPSPRWR